MRTSDLCATHSSGVSRKCLWSKLYSQAALSQRQNFQGATARFLAETDFFNFGALGGCGSKQTKTKRSELAPQNGELVKLSSLLAHHLLCTAV